MVCDDDVALGRATSSPVHEALCGKVRALVAQTFRRRGGEHGARHGAPAYTKSIDVPLHRLAGECIAHGQRRKHIGLCRTVGPAPLICGRKLHRARIVKSVQAEVVLVALEAREADSLGQDAIEGWQLMRDELVCEGVRLRGYACGHAVCLCVADLGKQVGHRLPNAGACLYCPVRPLGECRCDLERHLDLIGSLLKGVIHVT